MEVKDMHTHTEHTDRIPAHTGHAGHMEATGLEKVPETYEGWFSLHANYSINFEKWRAWSAEQQSEALQSFKDFIENLETAHEAHESSYAMYQINGHKGDIMFWF